MKSFWLLTFIVLIIVMMSVNGGFDEDLLVVDNFVSSFQRLAHAVVFLCDCKKAFEYGTRISRRNILFNIVIPSSDMDVTKILPRQSYPKCGLIIDLSCPETYFALSELSRFKYFNTTYPTLIINCNEPDRLAETVPTIGYNSNIYYANTSSEDNLVLFEIFSFGLHLHNTSVQIKEITNWSVLEDYSPKYSIVGRGDFTGTQLRGVTVIDIDNVLHSDVQKYLVESSKTNGVSQFVKYHYNIVELLAESFNFSVHYRVTRGWAGRMRNGYRLGLIGVLSRNEADVAGSGIFNRVNRFDEFDIIHQSWLFAASFIFRVDPDAVGIDTEIFLVPFTYAVWGCLVLITIIILLFMRSVYFIEKKLPELVDESPRIGAVALIGSYCQQGIDPIPHLITYRTIVIFVLILSSLLYNYYTSSIVGALLSSPIQGPETFEEIVNSPMMLMFEDIGYNKIMIHESKTELIKLMVQKKVRTRGGSNDPIPLYSSIEKSIPYLKRGIAIHAEATEAYSDIAKHFDANEICDLRIVRGPLERGNINFNLPKRSQYTEAFKAEIMWFQETGLIARLLQIYKTEQPVCLSSATIHAASINGVITAFFALGCGMVLAAVILIGEIIWSRRKGLRRMKRNYGKMEIKRVGIIAKKNGWARKKGWRIE